MPPLLLDDEEAVAIAVGPARPRRAARWPGSRRPRSAPWPSWSRSCPPGCACGCTPCRRRRSRWRRSAATARPWRPATLALLAQACRDRERLRFGYRSRDGRESAPRGRARTGWPPPGGAGISWRGTSDRQDWRTFRVDRLTSPLGTGVRFPPREPPRLRRGVDRRAHRRPPGDGRRARAPGRGRRALLRAGLGAGGAGRGAAACCAPAATRWSGWRSPSGCSAWTSPCGSRPS